MLENGKYRARPVAAALGLAETGTEQIAVQFELVDPPGERITWYGFFTDATTERTIQSLRFCGWNDPSNDLSVFVEGEPLPAGFDQEVELVIESEEYNGKVRTRVRWVNNGGGLMLKNALTKDQARAFADRMKRLIGAFDRAAGKGAPNATPHQRPAQRPPHQRPAPRRTGASHPVTSIAEVPDEVLEQQAASNQSNEDVPY